MLVSEKLNGYGPLNGVKVVELCEWVAAPATVRILSEMGAEIMKVEPLHGDAQRTQGPGFGCEQNDTEDPTIDLNNTNKNWIALNLKSEEGFEVMDKLLSEADVFVCNLRDKALVKLGLVPYGDIVPMTAECPTLTFNTIGRHQSRLVRTRVASNLSPWLAKTEVGDMHTIAISHGEGRFVASDDVLAQLKANGQIATQYVDEAGVPGMDLDVNPNGSLLAIEGITSPDGRVFGKMGHSERYSNGTFVNVPGEKDQPLFAAGVEYFAA